MRRSLSGPPEQPSVPALMQQLKALADPAKVGGMQQYFNVPEIRFLGINVPELRVLARDWVQRFDKRLDDSLLLELSGELLARPEHEAKLLAVLILAERGDRIHASTLPLLKRWLARMTLTWAVVDSLASSVLSGLLGAEPEARRKLLAWSAQGEKVWVRRASAVAFVSHARHGHYMDEAYEVARNLIESKHPYLHKANGWLLREAGRQDAARLKQFLQRHGAQMNRVTVRYAIERFPPEEYQELLQSTRG